MRYQHTQMSQRCANACLLTACLLVSIHQTSKDQRSQHHITVQVISLLHRHFTVALATMESIWLSLDCTGCQTLQWLRRSKGWSPDINNNKASVFMSVAASCRKILTRRLGDSNIRRSSKQEDFRLTKHQCGISSNREDLRKEYLYEANLRCLICTRLVNKCTSA